MDVLDVFNLLVPGLAVNAVGLGGTRELSV